MSVRVFILASIVPIFIALAAANAAALYAAKGRELERDLHEQASAAAVSAAEYFAARQQLGERLASASGRAALTLAIAQIEGLEGIYLIDPAGRCCRLLAGLAPERQPQPAGDDRSGPRVGAIEARSTGDHSITATVRLPDGSLLGVDLDADRLLVERKALRRDSLTILSVGVLAGIVAAALVVSWLTGDLRQLQHLLAGSPEGERSTVFRFVETKDAADAILLLFENLRSGASLRKQGILHEEAALDPATVLRIEAARRAPDTSMTIHGVEAAVGSIGQIEPGETFALIDQAELAGCIMLRAHDLDAARASGMAALAKRNLERMASFAELSGAVELMKDAFPLEMLVLAWFPSGEGALTVVEVRSGRSLQLSAKLTPGEARTFSLDERVTEHAGSLDRLGWGSAADRLRASQSLREGNALAASLRIAG